MAWTSTRKKPRKARGMEAGSITSARNIARPPSKPSPHAMHRPLRRHHPCDTWRRAVRLSGLLALIGRAVVATFTLTQICAPPTGNRRSSQGMKSFWHSAEEVESNATHLRPERPARAFPSESTSVVSTNPASCTVPGVCGPAVSPRTEQVCAGFDESRACAVRDIAENGGAEQDESRRCRVDCGTSRREHWPSVHSRCATSVDHRPLHRSVEGVFVL